MFRSPLQTFCIPVFCLQWINFLQYFSPVLIYITLFQRQHLHILLKSRSQRKPLESLCLVIKNWMLWCAEKHILGGPWCTFCYVALPSPNMLRFVWTTIRGWTTQIFCAYFRAVESVYLLRCFPIFSGCLLHRFCWLWIFSFALWCQVPSTYILLRAVAHIWSEQTKQYADSRRSSWRPYIRRGTVRASCGFWYGAPGWDVCHALTSSSSCRPPLSRGKRMVAHAFRLGTHLSKLDNISGFTVCSAVNLY
jgi:hypothetical protein